MEKLIEILKSIPSNRSKEAAWLLDNFESYYDFKEIKDETFSLRKKNGVKGVRLVAENGTEFYISIYGELASLFIQFAPDQRFKNQVLDALKYIDFNSLYVREK